MKKLLIGLILLVAFSSSTFAQRNYAQEADTKFDNGLYYDAIPLYRKAFTKVKGNRVERARLLYRIAYSYRMVNDTRNAEAAFRRVIAAKYPEPLIYLYYADALKVNEKYEEAAIQYAEYKKLAPDDPRADIGIESSKLAVQWTNNPTRYSIENIRKINTRENDFSPAYADRRYRSIIFTSSRSDATGKGTDGWTGQNFTDLFIAELDRRNNWSNPVPIDVTGEVNSPANEGVASFNDRYNTMYFSRCEVERKAISECQIYIATKRGKGWGGVEHVPLGNDSVTIVHPFISGDELTIYFSSNMPGGYGGMDIWMAQRPRRNRPFDKPINLGPVINTPGNEVFPTLKDENTLYFSSNYHPGLGGLDIFKSVKVDGQWGKPENMMVPLNSNADDFHMVFNLDEKMLKDAGAKEMGFFTSNRKGGRGGDDIYTFMFPQVIFTLSGIVYNEETKTGLSGVAVELVGSDGNVYVDTTDSKGFYRFNEAQVLENTTYDMTISKANFFGEKGRETTVGLLKSTDLVRNFYLVPIPKEPIVLPDILYDLGRWELKPQYQDSLSGLVVTLEKNPTIVIELQSHTDIRPIPMTNDTLSQRRAQEVVNFLIKRGIDPDRLVAKGYGDRVPRVLEDDKTVVIRNRTYNFSKGTVLSKEYIESLRTTDEREAAHSLNRRTTFQILHDNFVPKEGSNIEVVAPRVMIINEDSDKKEDENNKE